MSLFFAQEGQGQEPNDQYKGRGPGGPEGHHSLREATPWPAGHMGKGSQLLPALSYSGTFLLQRSRTLGTITPSAPLPGGCSNLPRPGGDNHIDFQAHPCPHGGLGGGKQFLTLEWWAPCPCPQKSQKAGVLVGEVWGGESSLGASGKMPPHSFPHCPPPGLSPVDTAQGSDRHCSKAAMR